MQYVTALFIGGPLDGQTLIVGGDLTHVTADDSKGMSIYGVPGGPDTTPVFEYRRHILSIPVGPENANAVFVPSHLGEAEAHRLIRETIHKPRNR